MQRRPTVGPGSQWPPFGNGSPEQFPNWVRVQHCKGGKHGRWRVGYGIARGKWGEWVWGGRGMVGESFGSG